MTKRTKTTETGLRLDCIGSLRQDMQNKLKTKRETDRQAGRQTDGQTDGRREAHVDIAYPENYSTKTFSWENNRNSTTCSHFKATCWLNVHNAHLNLAWPISG